MKAKSFSTRSVVLGFALALVVLYFLLRVVGLADVIRALRSADAAGVGAAFLVACCWMASWGYTLSLVLGVLDVRSSRRHSLLVYLNVLFANNIAPFSVGGGEPIAALFVSRSTRTSYETALLAVVSTDVLNYLPAPPFALLGLLWLATTRTLGRELGILAGGLLGVSVLLVAAGAAGWRYRRRIEVGVVSVVVALQRITARVVPGMDPPSPSALRSRIDAFVVGLERVAADRRVLALGLGSSALGWLLQAAVLWFALYSVGVRVPAGVPVFVVTLVTVTDLVPLPGGVGSVDAALVVLLVAVSGVSVTTATAAALIFRSATLAFPIVLGGATVAALQLTRTPD